MKTKRSCKVCGEVHLHCPFTDCYSEKIDGPLPDDLQTAFINKFGNDNGQ